MDDPLPPDLDKLWAAFFERHCLPGHAPVPCQDVFSHPVLFPLQRQHEMAAMLAAATKVQPEVAFEIGADKGGSLLHWCLIPSVRRVIGCEVRGTPYSKVFEARFPHIDFLWLPESSHAGEAKNKVFRWLGKDRIGCLFVDGDKSTFFTDFRTYRPVLHDAGVVFFHDINDGAMSGPRSSYENAKRMGFAHREIIDLADTEAALEREAKGIPPASAHEGWLRHWRGRSCGVGVVFLSKEAVP